MNMSGKHTYFPNVLTAILHLSLIFMTYVADCIFMNLLL